MTSKENVIVRTKLSDPKSSIIDQYDVSMPKDSDEYVIIQFLLPR